VPAKPTFDSIRRAAIDILIREQPQSGIRRSKKALEATPLAS
jgi:hypothetical protein